MVCRHASHGESNGAEFSVADIAKAAGLFPSQVTYHFGSKDALLLQAAFQGLLNDAADLSRSAEAAAEYPAFWDEIAQAVLRAPSLSSVVRALARRLSHPEMAELADTQIRLLLTRSERYLTDLTTRRGWPVERLLPVGRRAG